MCWNVKISSLKEVIYILGIWKSMMIRKPFTLCIYLILSHIVLGRIQDYIHSLCVCVGVWVCVCVRTCIHTLGCSVMSNSLQPHGLQPIRVLCPWVFPGKNTGVGCHFLLLGSSWPRDPTHVFCISCIDRRILYHWATGEVPCTFLTTR